MKAQLASPETFKQSGLDYATTLLGINFSIDKRPNGQSVIKLTSERPINDPFIDMLLELNWPAGRLVREYTFLLDPPEVAAKAAPLAPVKAEPLAGSARSAAPTRSASSIDDETRSRATRKAQMPEEARKPAEPSASADAREVRRGDTLRKIAVETKPEGVTLDQMLVGLLRANQAAFDGGNMNRLKAGKILTIPEKSALESLPEGEARKIVISQTSEWNSYRSKLAAVAASSPVADEASKQLSTGKITAKVEDKAGAAPVTKDQLKVSRTDTAPGRAGASGKTSEEDLIAKEKALKEANERLASLEKNVSELQKLVELKNQSLADLQKQAAAKPAPTEAPKPAVEPPKASGAPAPVPVVAPTPAPAPVPVPPSAAPAPAPVAAPVAPAPVATPTAVEAPKPEVKPVEAPKPKPKAVVPPPPPEEPGFLEELLGNPLTLAGGGGLLALIGAWFIARRRRESKKEVPIDLNTTLSPQTGSSLTANSVFRNTGGQSVDTSHTPVQTDFSQAGPGSIDTDEVDPVAEADVYMAYGRDAQAEEILVEARQKDPKRLAIHLKLLEIYSNRKDVAKFETLATDLYGETGGVGADWEKAAAMGLRIDSENPLFRGAAPAAPASFDADATVIVAPQSMKNTVTLPGELAQIADEATGAEADSGSAPAIELEKPATAMPDLTSLDFDLGMDEPAVKEPGRDAVSGMNDTLRLPEPAVDANVLDFDLAETRVSSTEPNKPDVLSHGGLDFNLPDIGGQAESPQAGAPADLDFDIGSPVQPLDVPSAGKDKSVLDENSVEFDVSMTESTFLGRSMPEPTSFDMASIDLDLNAPELSVSPAPAAIAKAIPESDPESGLESDQVSTNVNPEFSSAQAETLIYPQRQPLAGDDYDFGRQQSETLVNPQVDTSTEEEREFSVTQAATVVNPQFGTESDLAPEFEISVNEEVSTKLDLAKAYEEMGDLEGARELLNEVLKEGDSSHKDKAQAILARIGQ